MSKNQDEVIRCVHYLSKYLPLTENWIHRLLINHRRFLPIVLTRKKENLKLFPIKYLYSLDDFNIVRQYWEIGLSRLIGYFPFFYSICKEYRPEILHVHFGYHGVKLHGLKRRVGIPMVCSFYGDDAFAFPQLPGFKKKYIELFAQADLILVLGKYMKDELIKLGCPPSKLRIHHLGIDVDQIRFEKRNVLPKQKIKFLIASSFVAKKGIDLAIRALGALKSQFDFSLDIIGDGPLRERILQTIEESGMAERIKLHGYKPYDYFINLSYECDVFIQPSRTTEKNNKEGTPMAIVDAMATGLAVISTKHSDIPEIVIDGENGYLANENDLDSLTTAIESMLLYPERIEGFSVNGRTWVEKEFNSKIQNTRLEEFYFELLTDSRKNN